MDFSSALLPAKFVSRYKRFFCDAELPNGKVVTAHCPNPGSMRFLLVEGAPIWISYNDNPRRKLRYSWELVQVEDTLVGINTSRANAVVDEALGRGAISQLADYGDVKREVPYGKASRVDFLLREAGLPPCYLEVKSVTMSREAGLAEFPDSVTARGLKHLEELSDVVRQGARAVLLFLVQRSDALRVSTAADIDPAYAEGLEKARQSGVEILCYRCNVMLESIELDKEIPHAPATYG